MKTQMVKRIVEALLMSSPTPLTLRQIQTLLSDLNHDSLKKTIIRLQKECIGRGIELVHVATGWRYQTHADVQPWMERLHPEKPQKYPRATLETLAIIAYRQPITRAEIEEIRGVTVTSNTIKQLEERQWIEVIGYKPTLGRPALFATTSQFLADLGLEHLSQLPPLATLGNPQPLQESS